MAVKLIEASDEEFEYYKLTCSYGPLDKMRRRKSNGHWHIWSYSKDEWKLLTKPEADSVFETWKRIMARLSDYHAAIRK